jgi:N-acetylmuramoyl-L-alanine amidase-like protein
MRAGACSSVTHADGLSWCCFNPSATVRTLVTAFTYIIAALLTAGASAAEPEIMPRAVWGALPANLELMQEQKPSEIIIHHTGALQQPRVPLASQMRGLQNFSMNPGRVGLLPKPAWGDIPYHYYIDFAGKIAEGRDIGLAGDAVSNFDNMDRVQIVLEGDFEREQPTKMQLDALRKLVTWLSALYGISPGQLAGHGDYDRTDCPGKNLKPYLIDLKKAVRLELAIGGK